MGVSDAAQSYQHQQFGRVGEVQTAPHSAVRRHSLGLDDSLKNLSSSGLRSSRSASTKDFAHLAVASSLLRWITRTIQEVCLGICAEKRNSLESTSTSSNSPSGRS